MRNGPTIKTTASGNSPRTAVRTDTAKSPRLAVRTSNQQTSSLTNITNILTSDLTPVHETLAVTKGLAELRENRPSHIEGHAALA
jgi:hypothetical protein